MKDEIKEVFMFILLGGKEIQDKPLHDMLAILCDMSEISEPDDFKDVTINATTIFVEKCFKMIKNELYDDFIDLYRQELLKMESYDLLHHLHL